MPDPDSAGAGSRITTFRMATNSLYGVGAYLIGLPVTLLVSRFVVHRIGIGQFGIWAILTTIVSYGTLLDLGISTPLVKYVAEYLALGKHRDINILLSTGMVLYLSIGLCFFAGMLLTSTWVLVHIFHAGAHDVGLRQLYLAVLASFVLSLVFSVLQSLITGLQRVDVTARLNLLFNLLNAALIVVTLSLGMGVGGLALSSILTTVLVIARNWFVARHLFPALRLNPFLFRWSCLRMILRFSTKVQISSLTLVLNDQVDRTLIAYALGPVMAGYYGLASRAASALRDVSFKFAGGILPAASDLSTSTDTSRLRHLYLRSTRYLAILDFGLCAGVAGLAQPLMHAWMGAGYSRAAVTLVLLLAGYAVWLPNQTTADTLYGVGRPEIRLRADLAFLALHIPLSVLLIWRFGYFGTIIGTGIALSVTRLYIYVAGARELGLTVRELFGQSFVRPLIAGMLGLAVALVPQLLGVPFSWPALLAEGTVFWAVYGACVVLFIIDDYDRNLVRSLALPVLHRLGLAGAVKA